MMYLVTGYSGFLGKQILSDIGNDVCTLGRSENAVIVCDLSERIPQIDVKISRVIHVSGRAHMIPKTQSEKYEFFRVNLTGTLNLLRGLEESPSPQLGQSQLTTKIAAKLGDKVSGFQINSYRLNKLETSLTFDDSDARQVLGWGKFE
jgi:hypothetical protein